LLACLVLYIFCFDPFLFLFACVLIDREISDNEHAIIHNWLRGDTAWLIAPRSTRILHYSGSFSIVQDRFMIIVKPAEREHTRNTSCSETELQKKLVFAYKITTTRPGIGYEGCKATRGARLRGVQGYEGCKATRGARLRGVQGTRGAAI